MTIEESELIREIITEEQIEEALQRSQLLKSPGIDGITYELWKYLHQEYKKNSLNENASEEADSNEFSIIKLMTSCFNDMECLK